MSPRIKLLAGFSAADRSIAVLSVLYAVGIFGILLPIHPDFVLLTPLNLLVSMAVVLYHHPRWERASWGYLLLAYAAGFSAEFLGVQTGLLFGDYAYGVVLGPKLWGTPLMIGLNWMMLGYCAGVIGNTLLPGYSFWWRGLLAAALMVGLDVIIEPVAMEYGFWSWEGDTVPLQNYLGWFLVALPLEWGFAYWQATVRNKVGIALFLLQILFFASLLIAG